MAGPGDKRFVEARNIGMVAVSSLAVASGLLVMFVAGPLGDAGTADDVTKQGRSNSLVISIPQTEAKSDRLRVAGTTIHKAASHAAPLMPEAAASEFDEKEPVASLLAPFFADDAVVADPYVPISLAVPAEYGAHAQSRPPQGEDPSDQQPD